MLGRYLREAKSKSNDRDLYDKCGVYKLKCGSCPGVYLGQTGRSFRTRFKEHMSDIKHNKEKLASHITH
jgi:hypothetical protein